MAELMRNSCERPDPDEVKDVFHLVCFAAAHPGLQILLTEYNWPCEAALQHIM